MKKIILGLFLVMILFSVSFSQPVKGARNLGTFSQGAIYSYTEDSYPVVLYYQGYTNTVLVLYLSTSSSNPNQLTSEIYLYKASGAAYWERTFQTDASTETLYLYPVTGNQLTVWINP